MKGFFEDSKEIGSYKRNCLGFIVIKDFKYSRMDLIRSFEYDAVSLGSYFNLNEYK